MTLSSLTDDHFKNSAYIIGGPWTRLKALNKVESNGKPGAKLFEPHIFYRMLKQYGTENQLDLALKRKLAHKDWRGVPYRRSQFDKALQINSRCALLATSWGQFQIMGFNHRICGYESVESFVNAMKSSAENQLKAVIAFIKANPKMWDAYQTADWHTFARMYNGKLYYKNKYAQKLAHWAGEYKAKELARSEEEATTPKADKIIKDIGKGVGGVTILEFVRQQLDGVITQLKPLTGQLEAAQYMTLGLSAIIVCLTFYAVYKKVYD